MAKEKEARVDPLILGNNDAAMIMLDGIERFESIQSEIDALKVDQSEIMKELGGSGFDTKQVRRVIAARKKIRQSRERYDHDEGVFETYLRAVGISDDY